MINWKNKVNWFKSFRNTAWCLFGCAIGDFGTIFFFQVTGIPLATILILSLAILNGILTSIFVETILLRIKENFALKAAFTTAIGMSLISMISMEAAMNLVDFILTGGALLTIWVIPVMLLAGFVTPLPYNYWRLEKFNKSCCG